jgi:hypothetical protein
MDWRSVVLVGAEPLFYSPGDAADQQDRDEARPFLQHFETSHPILEWGLATP